MNKVFIIGNLTRDPEMKATRDGKELCQFTVAVARKKDREKSDFFRVTAWGELGTICHQYLAKGKKVCVTGSVTASAYSANNGEIRASLDVFAEQVEFLTPKESGAETPVKTSVKTTVNKKETNGFVQVEPDEELPF